jgi:hypothetical protein
MKKGSRLNEAMHRAERVQRISRQSGPPISRGRREAPPACVGSHSRGNSSRSGYAARSADSPACTTPPSIQAVSPMERACRPTRMLLRGQPHLVEESERGQHAHTGTWVAVHQPFHPLGSRGRGRQDVGDDRPSTGWPIGESWFWHNFRSAGTLKHLRGLRSQAAFLVCCEGGRRSGRRWAHDR